MIASNPEAFQLLRGENQWLYQEIARLQGLVSDLERTLQHLQPYTTVTPLTETHPQASQRNTVREIAPTEYLTSRERQVIWLIGQGRSNKDIARELQLSYSTVKNYVSSILKKLKLDGRIQIALRADQWSGELRLR